MSFSGELFVSEILRKPVLDPKGEDLGGVRDLSVIHGEPLPKVSTIIIDKKGMLFSIPWSDLKIFNKRVISAKVYSENLQHYEFSETDLLIVRDIFDKQIVDVNGIKVYRVNDIKLEGCDSGAVLVAVDVGLRGIMRRLGLERSSEHIMKTFNKSLAYNLISWSYIQPFEPKLTQILLTVPRQMVSELHPADIADIISQVSLKEGVSFLKELEVETVAEALSELRTDVQSALVSEMASDRAADIIEEMPPDEAADVLNDLPIDKAKEILLQIGKEKAEDIQELLGYEADTAGGLMNNVFISYPTETTVEEAIDKLKKDVKDVEAVYYIYVLDKNEKLRGVISLRDLLLANLDSKLSQIMETKLKSVTPETDEADVREIVSKYNLLALPVVDAGGSLLGVVTVDDILDRILPPASRRKRKKI
jgi:CBS domain-containing protein